MLSGWLCEVNQLGQLHHHFRTRTRTSSEFLGLLLRSDDVGNGPGPVPEDTMPWPAVPRRDPPWRLFLPKPGTCILLDMCTAFTEYTAQTRLS